MKKLLEESSINFDKDISKMSTVEKMEYFNVISKYIRDNSECQQGYVSIESFGGFSESMWGEASFRIMMSGSPDGYIEYKSLSQLVEKVRNIAIHLKDEGINYFR